MIRHIVFFSVKPDQDVEFVRKALEQLGTIPHSEVFEVVANSKVDPMGNEIDLVVYAEFRDEEALFAYKNHPTYDATTQYVRPMRELRFSADVVSRLT
ncbi:Dabb family protein [Falsochrobactrum sp. TDYN1]|uniref:Dabb family protein n=1 Tax=Falsochrobactrum tianjinense TaxID=2706015 RepID=A0A949UTQ0_9HYPH|nr:Dabb family protein [Falsochrobactrum sp. TDYN1]